MTDEALHPVTAYAKAVLAGDIVTGRLVRLACERHMRDLETAADRGWYFNEDRADHALSFFGWLRHYKGEWAGQPFVLEPWQEFVIGSVFGWVDGDGLRRFRSVWEEVARKNGKTTQCGGVGLYCLVGDGEPGAEIYAGATKRDQARLVFDDAKAMAQASPPLRRRIRFYQAAMSFPAEHGTFKPLAADADSLDGLNTLLAIVDEVHKHKTRHLIDVLETSMGARREPIMFKITTAGDDPLGVCGQEHDYAVSVLEGDIEDDRLFAYIATLDEGDDPFDEANWIKANPNLGVSVYPDGLRDAAEKARNKPGELNAFLRLRMNIWTQQTERWIDMDKWRANVVDGAKVEDLLGREAFGGVDLSSKIDLTAKAIVVPPEGADGIWHLHVGFYMPEENIKEREQEDRLPYRQWAEEGWITLTPGNVVDYAFIEDDLVADADRYDLVDVGFDPWNATQFAQRLTDLHGIKMVEVRQGFGSMSAPTKEFERLFVAKLLNHFGNPVLAAHANTVALREDPNGNYMPDKARSRLRGRIDGIVASILGVSRAMAYRQDNASVYDDAEWAGFRSL